VRTLKRLAIAPIRPLINAWQVSVQARVVFSTLLLGALVLSLTAWLLLTQISTGLVDSKRDTSLAQAEAVFSEVQEDLDAAGDTRAPPAESTITGIINSLASRSGSPPAHVVVLSGPLGIEADAEGVRRTSMQVSVDSVPRDLRIQTREQSGTLWTYTTIDYLDADDQASPGDGGIRDGAGIAVGTRLQTPGGEDEYALYLLYPFVQQEQALNLVARAVVVSGVLLMALVAGIAWLVTRQVVTPVRLARRIAERFASDRLDERIQVKGRDDIARLGMSFNQMATSLQRQIRQLEDLSRMQHRFVSDVSHELRTPLTTVRMAADVLHDARADFDPATARSAELLQAELDRFESLLIDLLEISRFDAGAARLELSEVDLVELAHQVVDAQRLLAERAGVSVRVLSRSLCATAQADPRRVERIVRNLVSNAIAHAQSRRVEVIVAADDQAAAVAVRDHGRGLGPGEATQVFARFWRADPARARAGGGTGLGLAIALEDAQLHGGWLQAWGEAGRGSQFRLTLPRRAGDDLRHSPIPLVPSDLSVGRAYSTTAPPPAPPVTGSPAGSPTGTPGGVRS